MVTGTPSPRAPGSCATGTFPDKATPAYDGSPRAACAFDTPSLLGVHDSAPYLHDGRLLTLDDTVEFFNLVLELRLTQPEKQDLVAYMAAL